MSPWTQQSQHPITSCSGSSFPKPSAFWKHSRASWRLISLSSFQNRDRDSLFTLEIERKACNAALSSPVHISPSNPCATWNVPLSTKNGLEESEGELGMTEESSLLMGERGGGPGVGGLCPRQGRGMGMAINKERGAKADCTWSGIGSPSPLQVQQRESWRDKMMAWRGIQCLLVKWSKAAFKAANFTNFPTKSMTQHWRLSTWQSVASAWPCNLEKSLSMNLQVRF